MEVEAEKKKENEEEENKKEEEEKTKMEEEKGGGGGGGGGGDDVNGTTIMWDKPVITDWTILANQSDIVLQDKKEKTCLLIDIAIPDETNANIKEAEKLSKYKPGDQGQYDMESEEKNCPSYYNWSIRNN